MACDEACTNIFRNGYHRQSGPMRSTIELQDNALVIQMTDEAPPIAA
jgi:hypothetical protein